MSSLTDLELDVVREVLNLGMGHASALLSRMARDSIELSIPQVREVNLEELDGWLEETGGEQICGVLQTFEATDFASRAMLLFPERQTLEVVKVMVGDEMAPDDTVTFESEALTEVGNIILNTCLANVAQLSDTRFVGAMPLFHSWEHAKGQLVNLEESSNDRSLLAASIDFGLESKGLSGYVFLLLDLTDAKHLLDTIMNSMGF